MITYTVAEAKPWITWWDVGMITMFLLWLVVYRRRHRQQEEHKRQLKKEAAEIVGRLRGEKHDEP